MIILIGGKRANMEKLPIISVIIPSHREVFLRRAVESVLKQTIDKDSYEIIVIKDYLNQAIDEFLTINRVRTLYTEEKGVFPKAILGIKSSFGKILCFLDDDDQFVSSKLSCVLSLFANDTDLVYLHNNFIPMNSSSDRLKFKNSDYDFNSSCISIRKDIINLDKIDDLKALIDTFYYLSAIESNKKVLIIKKKLTIYNVGNSVTNSIDSDLPEIQVKRSDLYIRADLAVNLMLEKFKNELTIKKLQAYKVQLEINRYFLNLKSSGFPQLVLFLRYASKPITRRVLVCVVYLFAKALTIIGFNLNKIIINMQIIHYYNQ